MTRAAGLLALTLGGCSILPRPAGPPQLFDLGPPAPAAPARPAPVAVADVSAPAWLESSEIHYRLSFDQPQQLRAYAQHKFVAPPAALVEERVREALTPADGAAPVPDAGPACTLRLTIDAFEQRFAAPGSAEAVIALRAELGRPGERPATRAFSWQRRSAPDAPGAARALAALTDAAIGDVLEWAASRCGPATAAARR